MQEYSPVIGLLQVAPWRHGGSVVKHGLYQSQFRPGVVYYCYYGPNAGPAGYYQSQSRPWYPAAHRHR